MKGDIALSNPAYVEDMTKNQMRLCCTNLEGEVFVRRVIPSIFIVLLRLHFFTLHHLPTYLLFAVDLFQFD